MHSPEVLLDLKANPAFQDLQLSLRQRRQVYLERLPREKDSEERLRLSGRALELEDIDNMFTELLKVRHDLDTGPPKEDV